MAKKLKRVKAEKADTASKGRRVRVTLKGEWWLDGLVLLSVVVYGVSVWWPTRYLPYFWDSASLVATGAHDLLLRNLWPPVLMELKTAHQPGLMVVLAAAWKIFGESRLVSHLVMVPALPTLMFASYWMGKKLYSPILGILAGFVTGVVPMVVAEYGVLSVELWVGAVAVAAVALWLSNRKMAAMLILAGAVLIKGSAMLVLPALLWWEWAGKKDVKKIGLKLYLIPVAALLVWYVFHMSVTGWLFAHPEVPLLLPDSVNRFLRYVVYVAKTMLTSHWRLVMTGTAGAAVVLLWERKRLAGEEVEKLAGLLIPVALAIVYFGAKGAFGESQSLIVMPFLVLGCLWLAWKALGEVAWFEQTWAVGAFGVAVVVAFLIQWQPKIEAPVEYVFSREADLSYQDMIYVGRASSITVEVNYPSAKIYGGYPEYYQLTEPYQGYVTRRLDFEVCSNFQPDDKKIQVVILHPYHPSQQACRILLDQYTFKPVQRFENNGAWVELYQYAATPSAEPTVGGAN